jgi:hypothetical protein
VTAILATMAMVFAARMLVVRRGWRSYRLGTKATPELLRGN